jgi:hypothetical protein
MRLWLLLIASPILCTGIAHAQIPIRHMGWGDSALGNQDNSPECSTLPDQSKLVVSFTAPANVYNLTGVWGYIDFCTKPYAVPPWWTFAPYGGCRGDSLSATADFSKGPSTRIDPWGGRGQTTFAYEPSPLLDSWGMARIEVWVQATNGAPIALEAGKEYYAYAVVFGNPDVGCDGCNLGACFVLNGLVLYHDDIADYTSMDYTNWCRWNGPYDCPFVVATQPTTWGRMKAQYR